MSTVPLTRPEALAIYTRLCAKAVAQHNRDDTASHVLAITVTALSTEYNFAYSGPDVYSLKHLEPADRADVLRLVTFILAEIFYPSEFREIHREAFAAL